jgi:hypothetical protein
MDVGVSGLFIFSKTIKRQNRPKAIIINILWFESMSDNNSEDGI